MTNAQACVLLDSNSVTLPLFLPNTYILFQNTTYIYHKYGKKYEMLAKTELYVFNWYHGK